MSDQLSIYMNEEKIFEFEKNTEQTKEQLQFIENMKNEMDKGIEFDGQMIDSPDKQQRADYVTMSLFYGIENKSAAMISASCSYLIHQHPDIKQINAKKQDDEISFELIFDKLH